MRTIFIRLAELILPCFAISAISCGLYYYAWIPQTDTAYGVLLFFSFAIYAIANVLFLRDCYFDLRNPVLYYILNYIAYAIFIGISVLIYNLCSREAYAILFNALQLMAFSEFDLSALGATVFSHVIMLIVIALAPIGMQWIFEIPDEEFMDIPQEYDENGEDQIIE